MFTGGDSVACHYRERSPHSGPEQTLHKICEVLAMRLIIKQRVFSWTDRFRVWDEDDRDRYYVEGEFFSFGKKLHITAADGREVALVQQRVFSFLPRFFVWVDDVQVAEIVKEFTFFHPRYTIDGLGWDVEGDLLAHDYSISQEGREIVTIHKEWLTWGDCYVLDIADSKDTVTALAVVLAIDCVSAAAATRAASANGF